jgi:hypothetical protein
MCYSKEVSITTYIIGTIFSILLLKNKKVGLNIAGGFFLLTIQMQMIDFLLWNNNKCNQNNINISTIGSIITYVQPIFLYILILSYNKELNQTKKNILTILLGLFIIGLYKFTKNQYPLECTIVTPTSKPYLDWSWVRYNKEFNLLYLCALGLLFYIGIPYPYNIYLFILCIGSYIGTFYIMQGRAFGTIWCWLAALGPVILYFTDIIYEYQINK